MALSVPSVGLSSILGGSYAKKPAVAGQFYPSSPAKLKEMIATMVKDVPKEDVSGAVVPHAGYVYCWSGGRVLLFLG